MKIVLLSGGMDSTYLAWRLLREGTDGVHLHHVSIRTSVENRWKNEDIAVPKIIEYFKQQGFKFQHSYSVSEFYDTERIGWDSDTVLLYAQKLAQHLHLEPYIEVLLGWNPHDAARPEVAERAERNVTGNIWKAQSASNRYNIDEELKFPLIEWKINKDTMFKELPKELLDMTWTCRRGGKEPCGCCHSCIEKESALAQHLK